MKDIPIFTGAHGVATLVLRQIPHSGCGYVIVRSVWDDAAAFLEECRGFCRACGAEQVYASWELQELPAEHAYDMLQMEMKKSDLPSGEQPELEDLTEENGEEFLAVYHKCFLQLPGAAAYDGTDLRRLLEEQSAWLVRCDGVCAAIAEVSKNGLEAIGVLPQFRGLGYGLAIAALNRVPSVTLQLKVASTNQKALALYERLGFRQTGVVSRWWKL